jgi:phosphatidylserine decarboxylase
MTAGTALGRRLRDRVNFLLTNRVPRYLLTRFMGWFSRIEQPLVCRASIALWQLFADLHLDEARQTQFRSLHDCFIRPLKDGARPVDPDPHTIVSPCDAIVGACGRIDETRVFQAKGFPYLLEELLDDAATVALVRDGCYATLRITSSMYHRFHAPYDCAVEHATYFSGDVWNVNPIALKRVERLFCKNERAALVCKLTPQGFPLVLVPVAAVLVASIRLAFLDRPLDLKYRGPNRIPCNAAFGKGAEMGWFEHGSTILVFAPRGFSLAPLVLEGRPIRTGEALMRLPV